MPVSSDANKYDESIEWLIYHPPKSAMFGHQSKIRNARKAWESTLSFVERHTHEKFGHICRLTCYGLDSSLDLRIMRERIDTARDLFGKETGPPQYHHCWELQRSSFETAVGFALDDDKYPKMSLGPSQLHFYYKFLWSGFWNSANSGTEIAAFDGSHQCWSHLGVYIEGQRLFLQPTFVFPGSYDSPEILRFIERIERDTPFRFRDQYFKRSLPSVKERKSGRGRVYKLKKGWRPKSTE